LTPGFTYIKLANVESQVGQVRRRALLAGAALSFGAFFWLAGVAAQQHWFDVDRSARTVIGLARDTRLDAPMQMVSLLGEGSGLIPLIALLSLLLWQGARRRWALALPVIMVGTGALQFFAKWAVDRPRPNLAPWGFPSGHVLSLVVFLGLAAYLLYTSRMGLSRRYLGWVLGGGTVLAVAFSRLYLDVHWLSDVVGGFALGLSYLLLTIWLVESLRYRRLKTAVVPLTPSDWAPDAVGSLAGEHATTSA
jgi:undecaprenyl-diphosphatase